MILPTKGVSASRALLSVGADVHASLRSPVSVAALWDATVQLRRRRGDDERLTFDWFSLALTLLHGLGVIEMTDDGRVRRLDASPAVVSE
jgi:hypothetical protein